MNTILLDRPTGAPERSLDQRMDALAKANRIRTRRARLKRDLKAGRQQVAGLVIDPPEWLETAKVFEFLLALPKVGRVKATRALTAAQVSPSRTLAGLSERQRFALVSVLPPQSLGRGAHSRAVLGVPAGSTQPINSEH